MHLQLVLEYRDFNIPKNCSHEVNGLRSQQKYIAEISASK